MDTKDAEFQKKLLAMFKIEAQEHLNVISSGLLEIDKADVEKQAEIVETVFREAHSLKGAARSVNLADIVALCQSMEDVFAALKRGQITLSAPKSELLQQTVDFCFRLVDGGAGASPERSMMRKLIRQLDGSIVTAEKQTYPAVLCEKPEMPENPESELVSSQAESTITPSAEPPAQPFSVSPDPIVAETVRVSTAKLDAVLLQAEEMIAIKLATGQRAAELRDLKKGFELWRKERRRDVASEIFRESHSDSSFISSFESRLTALVRAAEYDHRGSSVMVDKLLDDMKKTLMLPFSSLLDIFPRFVRDLARSAGKKAEVTTEGGEIEIDRRVLEEMKDPLIHLVRNCVDHGIEPPDERERKSKKSSGNIQIKASSKDGRIEIAISDDGAGINVAKMKSSAIRHALITQEAADKLSEEETLLLIFRSGVTTSPIITDISGRGLGLAIVREKVEKLNGTVTVETEEGSGTIFKMVVPLTLATFRGTLVQVSEQIFVLPSVNVERVARAKKEAIQTVENKETLVIDGRPVSLVKLGDVLELKSTGRRQQTDDISVQVVVIGSAERRMAFLVDEVLSEQEVLVKPLGRQLSRVRNIAAATVLGTGKVALVLNVSDLLKSAVKIAPSLTEGIADGPDNSRSVLVVEDSITARTLLKNILESAGYDVQTAVDGVDGITTLKSRDFDLVVSDVEMPRMNGFDLTAKIRSDKRFSELPVVLVTALDSREDKERGIDVGANAYIVKSNFDQSNLLEVIGRLI